jgi:phosphatidylinositol-3-phosphatase
MARSRRWLAAAVLLLILAACTSTAGRPGPGTGTAGNSAGSGPAAPGGLRAVRHVWVIELEDIFGLPHLGDAAMPQVRSFGPDVFG